MNRSKYREERTLVRGLSRLTDENRKTFKEKVNRLRVHFRQYNRDVSDLCQWIMSLRPDGKRKNEETQLFWDFMLTPEKFIENCDDTLLDWHRLRVFEVAAGWEKDTYLTDLNLADALVNSTLAVSMSDHTENAASMLKRLRALNKSHRMILIKSAAEWITSTYSQKMDNWPKQYAEWEKEKNEWEKVNPQLTKSAIEEFNRIFRELGITKKRPPRMCTWEKLKEYKDDCDYNGHEMKYGKKKKNHSELCVKYREFLRAKSRSKDPVKKHFHENTVEYLNLRRSNSRLSKPDAMAQILRQDRRKKWFPAVWDEYLKYLDINEDTILRKYDGKLPHCPKFDANTDCTWNPHTELCNQYRRLLQNISNEHLEVEALYRQWRREYLSGPHKPQFRYPSSRSMSVAKIFGQDYYEIDFDKAILRLRLEDMLAGEFLTFGFKPWPQDYDIQLAQTNISSVSINFVGTRARAGFRFKVSHRQSRFKITQDDIDILRSRSYPRQSQDQEFLDEVRGLLLKTFEGNATEELRLMAVDLGSSGGGAAIFKGEKCEKSDSLNLIKIDSLYKVYPEKDEKNKKGNARKGTTSDRKKGLHTNHIARHLDSVAEGAKKIAEKRRDVDEAVLSTHDMRRLTLHIGWMIRDWVRLNAAQISKTAETENVDLIVFESMRGFHVPGYDKPDSDKKRRLAFLAHGRVRRKTVEKAVERGMRAVTVPYMYSSKICALCGKKQEDDAQWLRNKTKRHLFECESRKCNNKMNSDENAARVLGRVFWGHIKLPVEK